MAAGNFYGVIPYEGRYDALLPNAFFLPVKARSQFVTAALPSVSGEMRDAKWLNDCRWKKIAGTGKKQWQTGFSAKKLNDLTIGSLHIYFTAACLFFVQQKGAATSTAPVHENFICSSVTAERRIVRFQ